MCVLCRFSGRFRVGSCRCRLHISFSHYNREFSGQKSFRAQLQFGGIRGDLDQTVSAHRQHEAMGHGAECVLHRGSAVSQGEQQRVLCSNYYPQSLWFHFTTALNKTSPSTTSLITFCNYLPKPLNVIKFV